MSVIFGDYISKRFQEVNFGSAECIFPALAYGMGIPGESVKVDPYLTEGQSKDELLNKLNEDAIHCVLAAATDRNLVVFDSQAEPGQLTERFIGLFETNYRRNAGGSVVHHPRLTDIYIRASKLDESLKSTTATFHPVRDEEWDAIEHYYTNDLLSSFAEGDSNLVLGIDFSRYSDCFVRPIRKELHWNGRTLQWELWGGLAVLNNMSLILGSY